MQQKQQINGKELKIKKKTNSAGKIPNCEYTIDGSCRSKRKTMKKMTG